MGTGEPVKITGQQEPQAELQAWKHRRWRWLREGACVRQGWIRSRIQPEEYRGSGEEGRRVTGGTDVQGGLGVRWGAPPASQLSGADRKLPLRAQMGCGCLGFLRLLTAGSKPAGKAVCLDLCTNRALDER